MSRERTFVVGSKTDTLGSIQLSKVLDLLKETHPRLHFVDFRDLEPFNKRKSYKRELRRGLSGVVQLLMRGEIDIAVADARELPLRMQSKVGVAAMPARGNPFDVLISREGIILDDQPENACLAGVNAVRKGQLLYYRPDLLLLEEEGAFDTMFEKMKKDEIDGFVYAASDVEALNKQDKVVEVFTSSICMPVAGQGALGLITRIEDNEAQSVLKALDDPSSAAEVELEKLFLSRISREGKGPVGVLGNVEGEQFQLEAAIASSDGSEKVTGSMGGRLSEESRIIDKLAEELLSSGGKRIMKAFKRSGDDR